MKRAISLILACLMLAGLLSGCAGLRLLANRPKPGSQPTNAETDAKPAVQIPDSQSNSPATDAKPAAQAPDNTPEPAPQTDAQDDANEKPPAGDFEPVTAIDNDACFLQITGIDPDNFWGYGLEATLENRSSDTTYMFTVEAASINGVETSCLLLSDVAPGKKSNETISFTDAEVIEQFPEITDIELQFRVIDNDDWSAEPVSTDTVHIYPQGEAQATRFVRQPQPDDVVIVDNEDIAIIVTGYDDDPIWGFSVKLFVENKTDHELMLTEDNTSVNGMMCDAMLSTSVRPNMMAFDKVVWLQSEFEKNNIETVEEIELDLLVRDMSDWFGEPLYTSTVTLYP